MGKVRKVGGKEGGQGCIGHISSSESALEVTIGNVVARSVVRYTHVIT